MNIGGLIGGGASMMTEAFFKTMKLISRRQYRRQKMEAGETWESGRGSSARSGKKIVQLGDIVAFYIACCR